MEPQLYSPLRPEFYSRISPEKIRFGVGVELSSANRRPAWNLYWLSDPAVDALLWKEEEFRAAPLVDIKMMSACLKAMKQESGGQLLPKLLEELPSALFAAYLANHDYKHLAPYQLRGDAWMTAVVERSKMVLRFEPEKPRGLLKTKGNVFVVGFGEERSATTLQ